MQHAEMIPDVGSKTYYKGNSTRLFGYVVLCAVLYVLNRTTREIYAGQIHSSEFSYGTCAPP